MLALLALKQAQAQVLEQVLEQVRALEQVSAGVEVPVAVEEVPQQGVRLSVREELALLLAAAVE